MISRASFAITIAILAIIGTIFGPFASAQTPAPVTEIPDDANYQYYDTGPVESDIEATINPEYPGAFQNVAVQLSSDYIDLSRYRIVWIADGKLINDGIGIRSAIVQTKNYGQITRISLAIYLPDTTINKQIILAPQDIALLWEAADAYAPAFYQGKKLIPHDGLITVAAIPNFQGAVTSVRPGDAVYNWKRNGFAVPASGGYGHDSVTFQHNTIRGTESIQVSASNVTNDVRAVATTDLSLFDPKIMFYEKNPKTGLRSPLAKSSLYFTGEQTDLIAEPYFFSVKGNNPNGLAFSWTMNDVSLPIANPTRQQALTLENPGESGSARIGLSIKNPATLFQEAKNALNVVWQGTQ